MVEQNPVSNSDNQEATQKSLPPEAINEAVSKFEAFLKQEYGMTIEEFEQAKRKQEEQKRQQLQLKLKEIETEIATLQVKRSEIIKQLGIPIKKSRGGKSNTADMEFAYEGVQMPANTIAKILKLSKINKNGEPESVNWKRIFESVLRGNSGGLTEEEQEKIRNKVTIIQ